jgi:hypothetical protein
MKTLVQFIMNASAAAKAWLLAADAAAQKLLLNLSKSDVGLGNVDNTSDASKPVSTAQAAAIAAKIGGAVGATTNRLVKSSGTDTLTVQSTGITVDGSNNVSGVGTISSGAITASGAVTATSLTLNPASLPVSLGYETYNGQGRLASNNCARFGVLSVGYNALGQRAFIGGIGGWADNLVLGAGYNLQFSSLTQGEPHTLQAAVDLSLSRDSAGVFGIYTDSTKTTKGALTCGAITASGALNLAPITKAALLLLTPNAATGGRWRVTDATPANREAYPDGTNWRYTSDDTVVT